ncbi:MAG: ribokinase [bacterium]
MTAELTSTDIHHPSGSPPGVFGTLPARRGKLLVVGAAVLDRIFYVESLPKPGETAIGDRMEIFPGGKGANQALAAAKMGAEVRFISAVGTDGEAEVVLTPLRNAGIDVDAVVRVEGERTAETVISVDYHGENQIVACPNAYYRLEKKHIEQLSELFEWADWLLIQNELPRPVVERAISMGLAAGVKVVFNTAPFKPHTLPPPRGIEVLIANEIEAAGILGVNDYFSITPHKRASHWREIGAGNILITLGRNGGEWFDGDEKRHEFSAIALDNVVDTVGAGDAFCGIFCALRAEGRPFEEAVKIAHLGAGLSVTRKGAQDGLPSRQELVAEMGRLK